MSFPKVTVGIFFIFFLFPSKLIWAKQYDYVPSISLNQQYDDNIYLYMKEKKSDFITCVKPRLDMGLKTERLTLKGLLQLTILKYFYNSQLSTVEQHYTTDLDYLVSERLSSKFRINYVRDTTLQSEWQNTGIALTRTIRKNYNAAAKVKYKVSERDLLSISPFYKAINYQSTYSNYWMTGVDIGLKHQLDNSKAIIAIKLLYNHTATTDIKTNNYIILGGLKYLLSETSTINFLAGINYLRSKISYKQITIYYPFFIVNTHTKTQRKLGTIATIRYTKNFETSSINIGIQRTAIPNSSGEIIIRNKFYFSVRKNINTRNTINLNVNYYYSDYNTGLSTINYYSYDIYSSYNYLITKHILLLASYRRQFYKNKINSLSATRNVVLIGIKWIIPYQWQ